MAVCAATEREKKSEKCCAIPLSLSLAKGAEKKPGRKKRGTELCSVHIPLKLGASYTFLFLGARDPINPPPSSSSFHGSQDAQRRLPQPEPNKLALQRTKREEKVTPH